MDEGADGSYIRVALDLFNGFLVKGSGVATEVVLSVVSPLDTLGAALVQAALMDALDPLDVLFQALGIHTSLEGDDVFALNGLAPASELRFTCVLGDGSTQSAGEERGGGDGDVLEVNHCEDAEDS